MQCLKQIVILLFLFPSTFTFGQRERDVNPSDRKVQFQLELSEKLIRKNLDSALTVALLAKRKLSAHTPITLKVGVFNNLGDIYHIKGDAALSLNYFLQSMSIVDSALYLHPEDTRLSLLKTDVLLRIGTFHLQLKNDEKALHYYGLALTNLEEANAATPKSEIALRKLKVYNNMAAVFIGQEDFDRALVYFRNALELNEVIRDKSYQGSILNNMGICYLNKKELDLASHYLQQSLKIRKDIGDELGQAQVLNSIAKNEVFKGNFHLAKDHFKLALALSRKTGNNASALISLESLSSVCDTLGNYREALTYYKAYKSLNDKIFNLESKTVIASLEEKHKRESDKKVYELKLKESESNRLKSQFNVLILFLLLLVALFFIIIMRNRIQRSKLQQEKLALERKNLKLERITLEENLESKEKELTAKSLFLLKNTELIARITENLQKARPTFSRENQQLIQEIISDLRSNQHNIGWEEFELHFTKVHSQFYETLQQKFPRLTPNEKKLCAFLRLNMSTKDISAITNQSVNSITVARTRLRKKLGIDGDGVHLINFLMSL